MVDPNLAEPAPDATEAPESYVADLLRRADQLNMDLDKSLAGPAEKSPGLPARLREFNARSRLERGYQRYDDAGTLIWDEPSAQAVDPTERDGYLLRRAIADSEFRRTLPEGKFRQLFADKLRRDEESEQHAFVDENNKQLRARHERERDARAKQEAQAAAEEARQAESRRRALAEKWGLRP